MHEKKEFIGDSVVVISKKKNEKNNNFIKLRRDIKWKMN